MNEKKPIKITREEFREILKQYRILWDLIESWPRRKIMTNYEKVWNRKRKQFLENHQKIEKLFKIKKQNHE